MNGEPVGDDKILLTADPIDTAALVASVHDAAAGGVCVFLGTTRAEISSGGHELLALDYAAYAEMAEGQLQDLARRARARWPVIRLALVHRTGRVAVGEASVLVAASAPHRGDAFECSRWLIDTLKSELAVWKKEVWADGDATWARPNRECKGSIENEE